MFKFCESVRIGVTTLQTLDVEHLTVFNNIVKKYEKDEDVKKLGKDSDHIGDSLKRRMRDSFVAMKTEVGEKVEATNLESLQQLGQIEPHH